MRGKEMRTISALVGIRITPAYAGKREALLSDLMGAWDHPRVCGEKACATGRGRTALGSPPRMRGKVYAYFTQNMRVGITPAYAGKRMLSMKRTGRL